jgi:hypothetical protein
VFASRQVVVWTLVLVLVAAAGYAVARSKRDFWDFEVLRLAGTRALQGEPLYRPDDGHYQYKYFPAFAFVVSPFSFIPAEAGKVIWYVMTVGLFALLVRLSLRVLPARRSATRLLVWCSLLLTGKFLVRELVNGQTNVIVAVLVMLALVVAARRPTVAGALTAASVFVKPYPLLLLPWVAVSLGVPAFVAALSILGAGLLFPVVTYGWDGNLDLLAGWYRTVTSTTPENLLLAENISFATMWAKWIGAGHTAAVLAVATTVLSLALAALIWLKRHGVSGASYLEVGLLLLLMPLISPQGWDYVLILAFPAYMLLVDRIKEMTLPWRLVTVMGFVLTSFTIYDLMGRTLYLAMVNASVVTVGGLLLAASLASLRLRGMA